MKKNTKKEGLIKEVLIDLCIVVFVGGLVVTGIVFFWITTLNLPDLSSFDQRVVSQSTKIYDRTGETILYDSNKDIRRTLVEFHEISPYIKNATIAIEDATFYSHQGVRPLAIVRSAINNILSGDGLFGGAGGSTITQQVIKNSVLQREKSITRKIKEAILAIRLEQTLDKDEILSTYLNESPYGGTIYGVEEASLSFFAKHANEVTLAEAAYIAALPQAPTTLSPYKNGFNDIDARKVSRLEERKNYVLFRMKEENLISKDEYEKAVAEVVLFNTEQTTSMRAPHFTTYVLRYIAEKYGDSFSNKGYKIITTVDLELQEKGEEIVKRYALENTEKYNASNAALVAADPKTGETLVLIGSRDFRDKDIDGQYDVATSKYPGRQPGSAFKPFIYAKAFEKGYTPETILFDVATQFSTSCEKDFFESTPDGRCYSPKNYDEKFRGPVSIRNSLAQSLNIPAVKTLYLAGVSDSIKLARDMGISTLGSGSTYGLTLVLGGAEVTLYDMVTAYSVFAAEGVRYEPMVILRIEDTKGRVIESFTPKSEQVLDKNITLQISDILSDNAARTPLYGSRSPLYFENYPSVAVKTGTTNDKKDVWVLGYSPTIVAGAWAGNNDNKQMKELSGLIITPLWRAFMDEALVKYEKENFAEPVYVETSKPVLNGVWLNTNVNIDNIENEEDLSNASADLFTGLHSILHYVQKDNPQGLVPENPNSVGQYEYWEYGVRNWTKSLLNTAQ